MVWNFFSRHFLTLASSLNVMKMKPLLFFVLGSSGSSMVSIWKRKESSSDYAAVKRFVHINSRLCGILQNTWKTRISEGPHPIGPIICVTSLVTLRANWPLQRPQNIPWSCPLTSQGSSPQQRSSWQTPSSWPSPSWGQSDGHPVCVPSAPAPKHRETELSVAVKMNYSCDLIIWCVRGQKEVRHVNKTSRWSQVITVKLTSSRYLIQISNSFLVIYVRTLSLTLLYRKSERSRNILHSFMRKFM